VELTEKFFQRKIVRNEKLREQSEAVKIRLSDQLILAKNMIKIFENGKHNKKQKAVKNE
jgi:hypothetical protein